MASDHPSMKEVSDPGKHCLWRMLRVFVRRCLSHVGSSGCFCRLVRPLGCRIIRTHCIFLFSYCICPTRRSGHLDTPNIFSLFFHCDLISLRWIGHLVSMVHWTSRLDGALDISYIVWTLSKGPKESYKYDLANSLVPLKISPIDCVVTRSPKSLEMG